MIDQQHRYEHCIAQTGRVKSWKADKTGRLPVSCTAFLVEDSFEGDNGINAALAFASHALRFGAGCAIHLWKLRPEGTPVTGGGVASGPVPFMKLFSSVNETVRRGGVYKNGAITCVLKLEHPDILGFITAPRDHAPWVKRCISIDAASWKAASEGVKSAVLKGLKAGDIWLAKRRYDRNGEMLLNNVCQEIWIKSRGTCLLSHINLGMTQVDELAEAFRYGMQDLCELHKQTGVNESGYYLAPEQDRQVGLGMLGLANLLAIEDVSYEQFAEAMEWVIEFHDAPDRALILESRRLSLEPMALRIAEELHHGIQLAAAVATAYDMDRAFCIAPTASCSYNHTDRLGNVTTPEIAPPIDRYVERDSGTLGVSSHSYGSVEVAEQVGWDVYFRAASAICTALEHTGLFHGYSFNHWTDQIEYNEDLVNCWLASDLTSMYYALQVMRGTQAKDDILGSLDDEFRDLYHFGNSDEHASCDPVQPSVCTSCGE